MLGTSPERQKVVQTPWELIARVRVNSLEQTANDPDVHGQNVQVLGDGTPQDWRANGSQAQNHDFDRRSVFSCETEWCRVLVVDFVDVLVEGSPMHCAVHPIVPSILQNEEDRDLICHCPNRRKGNASCEAEVLCHRVEKPDLRKFDGEVTE